MKEVHVLVVIGNLVHLRHEVGRDLVGSKLDFRHTSTREMSAHEPLVKVTLNPRVVRRVKVKIQEVFRPNFDGRDCCFAL